MGRICRVVPKEWTRYDAISSVIPNTRFLVFKTPLNLRLSTKIPKEKHFTLINLYHKVAEMGVSLGLIIDLTDTDRYYDRSDVDGMFIEYEKINCPGRGFLDRDDLVESFITAVDNFLYSNSENETLIGVHCTNGVNRSGYLICRFLVDRLGWSSHEAIDAFERARGYQIGRGSYVQAIHRAAKERRFKKRHRHNEEMVSSEESETRQSHKRDKHKKRRKIEMDEGIEPDMEAIFNSMALAFEQHESVFDDEAPSSYENQVTSMPQLPASQSSSHLSTDNSPFIGSSGTAEQEEDEEDETMIGEKDGGGEENDIDASRSKKRRERRQRLQKQFDLMKTGNFWKINEMQKEKFIGK